MPVGRTFQVGSLHLGPAANGDPRKYLETSLPQGGQLGQIFEKDGRFYRLVKVDLTDAVDGLDGGVAYWADKASYAVTFDASGGEAGANGIAGGCHKVVDVSTYTINVTDPYIFIQVGGDQAAVVVAASAVAGDHMTGHASTDNVLTRTAAGTAPVDLLAAVCLSTRGTTTSDNGASVSNSSKVRWILGSLI